MGTSDYDINTQIINQDEQSLAVVQAQREQIKQYKQQQMAINMENKQVAVQLKLNEALYNMRGLPPEKMAERYSEVFQEVMTNEEWSPEGTDDPQEKIARQSMLRQFLNDFQLKVQQVVYENDNEQLKIDTTNKINAIIGQTTRGDLDFESAVGDFSALVSQMNQDGRFNPSERNNIIQNGAAQIYEAGVNKKVNDIIGGVLAGEIIDVNGNMLDDVETAEGLYTFILDELGNSERTKDQTNIFESLTMATLANAKKQLQDYNEQVFKDREAEYQNFYNNGFYEPAREVGRDSRAKLDEAWKAGNVSREFYFQAKDYFKPFTITTTKDGVKAAKGLSDYTDLIIDYFDMNGHGVSPY